MIQTKNLLFLFFSVITFCANAQWVAQQNPNKTNLTGVDFYDNKTGIVTGIFDPSLYRGGFTTTETGGNIWTSTRLTDCDLVKYRVGKKIVSTSVASGQMYFNKKSITTLDSLLIGGWVNDFSIPDSSKVHFVGSNGSYSKADFTSKPVYYNYDNLSTNQQMFGVHFPDTATGYTCGDAGTIRKTTTGGKSWTAQSSGSSSSLRSVFFISKNIGWIVGSEQTVLITTNGGITWKRTSYLGGGTTYRSVKFVAPKIGYICGDFGTIMKTTDGGNTWKAMQTGTYETLNQLAFPDSLNGWAVGTNGTILYLNEDKKTPKVQTVTPSDTFMCTAGTYSVAFAVNKKFNTGNIFTAQLSDGQGNWGSPQTLGTLVLDTSGSINFTLGKNQVLDGGYRIRIVSSAPAQTSVQTQSPLSVDVGTPASVSISNPSTVCEGNAVSLTGLYTNGGFDPIFQWYINGAATNSTSTNFSSTTLKKGDKISFQMVSSADCPVPKRPVAIVDAPVTPIPPKPSISQNGNTLFSSANAGNQWELNASPILGAVNSQYIATSSGSYRVKVKDGNCESEYSDVFPFIITGAETNNLENLSTTIYPVPCTNVLHFETNISVQTILLKDITGRILLQENGESKNRGSIEITMIQSGIYYLELLGSNGKQDRKTFLKQ